MHSYAAKLECAYESNFDSRLQQTFENTPNSLNSKLAQCEGSFIWKIRFLALLWQWVDQIKDKGYNKMLKCIHIIQLEILLVYQLYFSGANSVVCIRELDKFIVNYDKSHSAIA